ncbi:MAG: acetyl/propionyl/methylcrotonyl-CoA carboxylase subunit alpha [Alphaproteobacteria bacterium]|nr:acetyl/propionyl/methylcrotonyl-CoA carboxylase subunit alpha [Alphaproteobacteria bacterium]
MFSSVLIANRGEIACRIIKTAKRLGMRTIAVYSEPDADGLHVQLADEAHLIGPADAGQSYLDASKILKVAAETGAQCIHPGYGFLSENADFSAKCAASGMKFVGPPPEAIRAMGLKDAAKALMADAGVPVVPGYMGDSQGAKFLELEADKIGYPVLIKAVAGGGGKGMRKVEKSREFAANLESCRREAKASFGDDRVLIEKFVEKPRHIEVQVFADAHGHAVHLFERDCSLQRRHQKVIEEAPAPGMTDEMRSAMGQAAVLAAQAVGYEGAGTVEFIVDTSKGLRPDGFFFMEMNTRLQVEHPVTEMITGIDLVEQQFRAAVGEPLRFSQGDLTIGGHAVEARLYAEDPLNGFLPQAGTLHRLEWPPEAQSLRIDTGVMQGAEISPFYDPMIAKVIAHGSTRADAIARLVQGLRATDVFGLRTNLAFLTGLLEHEAFGAADLDTAFIETHWDDIVPSIWKERAIAAAVLCAFDCICQIRQQQRGPSTPWDGAAGWNMAGLGRRERLHLVLDGVDTVAAIDWGQSTRLSISTAEASFDMLIEGMQLDGGNLSATYKDEPLEATCMVVPDQDKLMIVTSDRVMMEAGFQDLTARDEGAGAGGALVRAPMSGRLIGLSVSVGQNVAVGDPVAILEAMKMEHTLTAGLQAKVMEVNAAEGDQVEEGQVLVVLEAPE